MGFQPNENPYYIRGVTMKINFQEIVKNVLATPNPSTAWTPTNVVLNRDYSGSMSAENLAAFSKFTHDLAKKS